MDTTKELLAQLTLRLPELEWNISKYKPSLSSQMLPQGLFHCTHKFSSAACIEEIRADIKALALQENATAAFYIAQGIHQKINVLVKVCTIQKVKSKPQEKNSFTLNSLSTRQQWVNEMEAEIAQLNSQKLAMTHTLDNKNISRSSQDTLEIQAEIGEIEKRLTQAREALDKALAW